MVVVLFGLAGWFLYVKIEKDKGLTEELNTATESLRTLSKRNPHPGTADLDNISTAANDQKALTNLLEEMRRQFPQPVVAGTSSNRLSADEASRAFKFALDEAIEKLNQKALTYGVDLPPKFYFTFEPQQNKMAFSTNTIGALSAQLVEVTQLVELILSAKPAAIVGLKRIPVAPDDTGTQSFLVDKPVTNQWAVLTPYEVTFQGSSGQLAAVLEGFMHGNHNFVVRNVRIPPATAAIVQTSDTGTDPTTAAPAAPMVLRRTGPGPVLQEKTLKIILDIDAVQTTKPST